MKPEKHGAAAGEAGKPDSADWTIDQGWENYTAEEHRVWKTLFERQSKLLPGRACDEFIQGMRNLTMDTEQIPDFRRLSEVLMKRTGWQVVAVPGLVPDERFSITSPTGVSPQVSSSVRRRAETTETFECHAAGVDFDLR